METGKKRALFLVVILLLVLILVIAAVFILLRGPRQSVVELVSASGNELTVDDFYEGKMTIPKFNIAANSYEPDSFTSRNGIVIYEGGTSLLGVNVNEQKGEIDWSQVAAGGVDYAMIRAGYREYKTGRMVPDSNFEANIKGATEAGLPVGVYFYSKAVNETEAEEEATYVLEQIRGYNVDYPLAIYWEYNLNDDGSRDVESRTVGCNGDQITAVLDAFCRKVKQAGFTASYYCDKDMGYHSLDLEKLSGYEMWYAELKSVPSFYYDFSMWQFTKEGTVPGIPEKAPLNLSFKKYG